MSIKKRFIGKGSASTVDGRVVFHGDWINMSKSEWDKNSAIGHLFVEVDEPKKNSESKEDSKNSKSKKNIKE